MVVSSETPWIDLASLANQPGLVFTSFLMRAKKTSSSSLVGLSRKATSPCSARRP